MKSILNINGKDLSYKVIFLLVSLCVQNITLLKFGEAAGLKVFHVAFLFVTLICMNEFRLVAKFKIAFAFVLFINTIALILMLAYGFNSLTLNYIFLIFILYSVSIYLEGISYESVVLSVRFVLIAAMAYVLLNLLMNYSSVKIAQASSVLTGIRPEIPNMLFSGGINLEASWIAMLTVFFMRSKYFILVVIGSFVISSAYLSRTGMLLTIGVYMLSFIESNKHKYSKKTFFFALPLLLSIFVFFAVTVAIQLDLPVIRRFLEIGNEPGSQGRLDILFYVFDGLYDSMFLGYGAGNAMMYLMELGLQSHNDNVHNYFLQVLLDFGISGFLAYALFTYYYLKNKNIPIEFKFYYILYLIGSLVQFRGAEPLFWFLIFCGLLVSHDGKSEACNVK